MLDFNQFVSRHGEFGVQAILERLERYEGVRHNEPLDLQTRWNAIMNCVPPQQYIAA